jgi:Alginate export
LFPFRAVFATLFLCTASSGSWDVGKDLNTTLAERTNGRLRLIFELRSRLEDRPGQSFGAEPDLFADYTRTRVGLQYKPLSWFRITAVGMDARAPLFGPGAPSSARDPMDLHEAYVEIRPDQKLGFGATIGRQTANYGDTRLIGSPQWAFIPRAYDGARVYWRAARMRFDVLLLSPVKLNNAAWNKPIIGERVEGVYNSFTLHKHLTTEIYALRHHQNRPGGFTGIGRLITNSFGVHAFGPIARGFRYNVEIIGQTGHIGALPHRANAWSLQFGKQTALRGRPLDFSAEYKYASGTSRADRSGTFDQIFPAAHDKLGHADVLGWRNVRNWKALAVYSCTNALTLNLMYNNSWLADARDGAYNSGGRPIARSASGTAGTHIGQEADLFLTYKRSGWQFGAGYGHFFNGEFIRRTTPGVSPRYAYVFQSYSF